CLDPFGPETREPTRAQVHTSHACGAGNHVCSVSVQGDVNPCSFLGPAFNGGNVREAPFEVIWRNSQQFRRMRYTAEGGFRGGCGARAQAFAGSPDAPDPWFEQHRGEDPGSAAVHPGANVELCYPLPLAPAAVRGGPVVIVHLERETLMSSRVV